MVWSWCDQPLYVKQAKVVKDCGSSQHGRVYKCFGWTEQGCLNSVVDCSTCILLGQIFVPVVIFLQWEHSRVWCREGQASSGNRNRAVVWANRQGQLYFLCWETEFGSSGAALGWCGSALFEVWSGGGAGCGIAACGCIGPGWHLLERGCSPSAQCVHGLGFSPGYSKVVMFALVGESPWVRVVKSANYIFVIFGRVGFLTEHFSRASCCLASALRCQLQKCCRGTKSLIYFSAWCAEVRGKKATLRDLCWKYWK